MPLAYMEHNLLINQSKKNNFNLTAFDFLQLMIARITRKNGSKVNVFCNFLMQIMCVRNLFEDLLNLTLSVYEKSYIY